MRLKARPYMKTIIKIQILFLTLCCLIANVPTVSYAADNEEKIEIHSVSDLYSINSGMGNKYILMEDLDLAEATGSGGSYNFNGGGWDPIGYSHASTYTAFTGELDGNGHSITGLTASATQGDHAGLFACIGTNGIIKNLKIGGIVTGAWAGMVAGENRGRIENCSSSGSVYGTETNTEYAGGLTGYNTGTITNCSNNAYLQKPVNKTITETTKIIDTSKLYSGGIAGYNTGAILNSFNAQIISISRVVEATCTPHFSSSGSYTYNSNLSSSCYAGGIAGINEGQIARCYNTAPVAARSTLKYTPKFTTPSGYALNMSIYQNDILRSEVDKGGIAGNNTGSIDDCYNAGRITGASTVTQVSIGGSSNIGSYASSSKAYSYSYSGGIAGSNTKNVRKCYNRGQTSSTASAIGGDINTDAAERFGVSANCADSYYLTDTGTGNNVLTDAAMKVQANYSGWDFANVWTMNQYYEYPYPQLRAIVQNGSKVIDSVTWRNRPSKIRYYVGEELDVKGGYIRVYYIDGTSEAIAVTPSMVSGFSSDETGTKTLTVKHRGYTLEYQVEVIEEPEISSVEEAGAPEQTEFLKNTEPDYTGWKLLVNYVDNTSRMIDVTSEMVSGVDNTEAGVYTAVCTYKGFTFEHDISIVPLQVTGIRITQLPARTTYIKGETISFDRLKAVLQYNDGLEVSTTDFTISDYDPDMVGVQTIIVSYDAGESVFTDQFDLTIEEGEISGIAITKNPTKLQYVKGQSFNPAGMVVTATYTTGFAQTVTDYTCSELTESLGEQTVVVSYKGHTADVTVDVIDRVLQEIAIAHLPNKTQYAQNQEPDKTGLKILASFNDGNREEVTDYTLSGFNTRTLGTKTVTVTYQGKTAEFTIKVTQAEVTNLEVTSEPDKTSYLIGEPLDLAGLVVTANYNNGLSEEITDYQIEGFDGTLGLNMLTISYDGIECNLPVYVHIADDEWVVIEAPSCITSGRKVRYCTECGEEAISEVIDATGHDFAEWEIINDSSCTEEGFKKHICRTCGFTETEGIDKKEHDWNEEYTIDSEPTCVLDGSKSRHCSNCEAIKDSTVIRASGHDFTGWVITEEATCTGKGEVERECKVCHIKETMEIPANEHDWKEEYTIDTPATCTETGSKSIHCKNCNAVLDDSAVEIAAKGHSYGQWEETIEPTCTDEGEKIRTCSICGDKEMAILPANEHKWSYKAIIDVEPTCTEVGSKSVHCRNCDAVKEGSTEQIDPKGHSYGSWETTTEPTCTDEGEKARTCSVCGAEDIATIPKTGHVWLTRYTVDKEPTCTETGEKSFHCKFCDVVNEESKVSIDALGHDYIDSIVEPTCSQAGYTIHVCTRCGDRYTDQKIPAKSHSFGDWTIDTDSTCTTEGVQHRECSECGYIETKGVNKKDHTFSTDYTVDKTATCTTDGSKSYHCMAEGCTATTGSVVIPAEGHKYTAWIETKILSCTEDGDAERRCTECGVVETIHFEARGHIWMKEPSVDKAPTCTEEGSKSIHCAVCDASDPETVESMEKTAHLWDSGETTTQPTCTEEGEKTYTCTACGETKAEVIDKLGHDWDDWTVTREPTGTATGEKTRRCKRNPSHTETEVIPASGYAPGKDPNQKGSDGTAVGPGASETSADKAISSMTSDTDPKGSVFSKLQLKSQEQTNSTIQLKWAKVGGATKYVVYGNKCGKGIKPKKIATLSGNVKTIKKVAGKKLQKGKYYKFIIVALNKNNNVVSTSKLIHVATKGGKVGNNKSVTVTKSVLNKAKALKKGNSLKLGAKLVLQSKKLNVKKHVGLRYESTKTNIATVSSKGVIKAKSKGTCYVYAYAQNGVFKKVKVIVK